MRKPKPPKPITAGYLEAVTGFYLERYATTSAHLRRLLMQRARRSVAFHGGDLAEATALVDAEIARLQRLRLLDDARYATDRARALHRRGGGSRRIRAVLASKGLSQEQIEAALDDVPDDWHAALTYARKRRLGPWRTGPLDPDRRAKELGRLGRAGFSWEVARRVVELDAVPDDDAR